MSLIFEQLSIASNKGVEGYSKEYLATAKNIFPIITDERLLKSHIKTKDFANAESMLRETLQNPANR